jgi:hypothetical protein
MVRAFVASMKPRSAVVLFVRLKALVVRLKALALLLVMPA